MMNILPYSLKKTMQPQQQRLMVGRDIMPYTQSSLQGPVKRTQVNVQDRASISVEAADRYNASQNALNTSFRAANGITIAISGDAASGRTVILMRDDEVLTSFELKDDTRISWSDPSINTNAELSDPGSVILDEGGKPVITQGKEALSNGALRSSGYGEILFRVSGTDVAADGNVTTVVNLSGAGGNISGGKGRTLFMGAYQGVTITGGSGESTFAGTFTDSVINGGTGKNIFSGIFAHSQVEGGDGADAFSGLFLMNSTVNGNKGDDLFSGQFLDSVLSGGDGDDSFGDGLTLDKDHMLTAAFVNAAIDMGEGKNKLDGGVIDSRVNGGSDDDLVRGFFLNSLVSLGNGDNSVSAALAAGSLFRGEGGDDSVALYAARGNTVDMGAGDNSVRLGQDTATGTWLAAVRDENGEIIDNVDLLHDLTGFTLAGEDPLTARSANGNVVRGQNEDMMALEEGPTVTQKGRIIRVKRPSAAATTRGFAAYWAQARLSNGFVLPQGKSHV